MNAAQSATTIYALCAPDGEIRYVGKTTKREKVRFAQHMKEARYRTRTHSARWIMSLSSPPTILPLVVVPDEYGSEMERRVIAHFRSKGYRLTNLTDGGEGASGAVRSPETRARIGARLRGRKLSPEHIQKLKGKVFSAETRAKLSASQRGRGLGRVLSAETCAKMSAANIGRKLSPEHCAKIGAAHKGQRHTVEARLKMSAAKKGKIGLETRSKISAALMGNKSALGHTVQVETRARLAAASRDWWANNRDWKHTPEARVKMSTAALRREAKRRAT